jgi:hypothetical protein
VFGQYDVGDAHDVGTDDAIRNREVVRRCRPEPQSRTAGVGQLISSTRSG